MHCLFLRIETLVLLLVTSQLAVVFYHLHAALKKIEQKAKTFSDSSIEKISLTQSKNKRNQTLLSKYFALSPD